MLAEDSSSLSQESVSWRKIRALTAGGEWVEPCLTGAGAPGRSSREVAGGQKAEHLQISLECLLECNRCYVEREKLAVNVFVQLNIH